MPCCHTNSLHCSLLVQCRTIATRALKLACAYKPVTVPFFLLAWHLICLSSVHYVTLYNCKVSSVTVQVNSVHCLQFVQFIVCFKELSSSMHQKGHCFSLTDSNDLLARTQQLWNTICSQQVKCENWTLQSAHKYRPPNCLWPETQHCQRLLPNTIRSQLPTLTAITTGR